MLSIYNKQTSEEICSLSEFIHITADDLNSLCNFLKGDHDVYIVFN